jgi:hypothetical protein
MVKRSKDGDDEKDRGLGDILKKITSVGMGAAFLTEDTIKSVVGDLSLPKDITNALIQNAKNAKGELLNSLGDEFRNHLAKIESKEIVDYIAKNYDININVSFSPKESTQKEKKDGEQ